MKKKSPVGFVVASMLLALFILFTVAVMVVDVQPIGPEQTSVGFAMLNQYMFKLLGTSPLWYTVTDCLGIVAILVALGFGVLGAIQLIKRKSLKQVDNNLIALAVFYVAVAVAYVFFEVCVINYRPVLVEGKIEPSYPSSHTMLVLCIMGSAMVQFYIRIKNVFARVLAQVAAVAVAAVTAVGRLASGVHWFTDILGGVLLSLALVVFYYAAVRQMAPSPNRGAGYSG